MARALHKLLIPVLGLALLIACSPQGDEVPQRAPTMAGSLQTYQTPSPSAIPLTATPISTSTPLPTATPHIYTVRSGDTMGSIALEFGLDIGDLVNANPDVSPSAMSIGQELIIPDKALPNAFISVEPLQIPFADPDCYPSLSGGMWCFVLAQNDIGRIVEGISFEIQLYDAAGERIASETAFPLLDRLPDGEFMPALVHFVDVPADAKAYATLRTAFEGDMNDERYALASLQGVLTQVSWDGRSADVSGEVLLDVAVEKVWVLATAFDAEQNVIGVRRWEAIGDERAFFITVSSLGSEIDRVSLSVEAQR